MVYFYIIRNKYGKLKPIGVFKKLKIGEIVKIGADETEQDGLMSWTVIQ